MKRIIHFTAQFQGSIEVDMEVYEDWDDEDILADFDSQRLFDACETDLTLTELNDLAYTGWHLGYLAVGVHTVELHIKRRYGTELSWQTDSFTITISA